MTCSKTYMELQFCSVWQRMLHVFATVTSIEFLKILVHAFCTKISPLAFDRVSLFVNASTIVCIHILQQNKCLSCECTLSATAQRMMYYI